MLWYFVAASLVLLCLEFVTSVYLGLFLCFVACFDWNFMLGVLVYWCFCCFLRVVCCRLY